MPCQPALLILAALFGAFLALGILALLERLINDRGPFCGRCKHPTRRHGRRHGRLLHPSCDCPERFET